MSREKDKIKILQETKTIDENGQVINTSTSSVMVLGKEPNYVKVYLDTVLTFKDVSKSLNPILFEFLKYMSYANIKDNTGGQIIFVNKIMKEVVANSTNVTIKRVEQAITQFVKAGIFKRVGMGTYQVNPNIFGKGDWKDIKKIRATFDFNTGEIKADIE